MRLISSSRLLSTTIYSEHITIQVKRNNIQIEEITFRIKLLTVHFAFAMCRRFQCLIRLRTSKMINDVSQAVVIFKKFLFSRSLLLKNNT